jgi:DMSO/TMAO reductase YedYZ molybdopterin-dependent catalytic subunit
MKKRRQFIRLMIRFLAGMAFIFSPLAAGVRLVWAKAKKIVLPKGTPMTNLIGKNPGDLDTRNLEVTPLEKFETMGLADHKVNLNDWRLEIGGLVELPVKLSYSQVTELSPVKREVLLICPGFFAYHARWEGVSVAKLLEMAGVNPNVTHVSFSGPNGKYEKSETFPLEDILSGKVFLAYRVNDRALPIKHGFPLRVVAEGYYGGDWVKYVYKVEAHKS